MGIVYVVFGEVLRTHVHNDIVTDDGKIDTLKNRSIARMGYYDYTVINNIVEMRIPGSEQAAVGLEGMTEG